MRAVKIRDNIYWVGGIDWDLRNFHGYVTQRGSSYNAYLIIDEKITLIDTVKHYLSNELIKRVSSVIDPSKIDYIISNHVEMDHTGALPTMLGLAKNAKLLTSPQGKTGLIKHFGDQFDMRAIENGEILNTGKFNLQFFLTPMLHWPDNMVTYLKEEEILFSNDAFGQHIASSQRYAYELNNALVMEEAKKYYANIVLPFGTQVQKTLEAVSGLKISLIAPSHGVMWKKHIGDIIDNYSKWAKNETIKKSLIVYDSMWGSTKIIAQSIQSSFDALGYITKLIDLKSTHISDIMTDMIDAEYLCVGSPTLNNNMLPTVAAFLTYLKGLAPKNRKAMVFGSYGWGGQSIKQIENILEEAKFELTYSTKYQYIPIKKYLEKVEEEVKEILENK